MTLYIADITKDTTFHVGCRIGHRTLIFFERCVVYILEKIKSHVLTFEKSFWSKKL